MSEQEILILLNALDNASKTIADASSNVKASLSQVEGAAAQVEKTQQKTETSSRAFALGLNNVATSAFSLYDAYDRVADMQVSVDRANLAVKTSLNSAEDAQRRYTEALLKHGADSDKAKAAQADLSIAQERHNVAVERAEMLQGNLNEAMVRSALQVIPTVITGIDGFYKVTKNFPDLSGPLGKVSSGFDSAGLSAKTAALGVAGFVGGFMAGDAILKAVPENLRGIASALMVGIAAVVAATVAWMALQGTMTMGVAIPVILAAVGAGIAGVKGLMGLAEGGVVASPTVALIGEAGPEAVIPLNRANDFRGLGSQNVTVNLTIPIYGDINSPADIAQVKEAAVEGLTDALWRRRS